MKKLLIILFLLSAFVFYSHADEKDKDIPWYLSSPGHYNYSTYPPSLFDPNYLDKHNRWQEYFNSFTYRPRGSAIVVPRPPSFGESFLAGFSRGMSRSMDYYYRKKQQDQYTKTMLKLLESPPIPKYTVPNYEEMSLEELIAMGLKRGWMDLESLGDLLGDLFEDKSDYLPEELKTEGARTITWPLPEYKMSREEKQANRERIIELDRIIKLKKERANLDKLFREAGWLDKDRIEYLNKYYPLPLTKETKFGWLDSFDPLGRQGSPPLPEGYRLVRPGEKEEDDLTKYMRSIGATRPGDKKIEKPEDDIVKFARSQGAMLPWEYKTKKLNEYLKSQGLSLVPENVDVNQVYDGDWVIYWDGEKWARKKKEVNHEDP